MSNEARAYAAYNVEIPRLSSYAAKGGGSTLRTRRRIKKLMEQNGPYAEAGSLTARGKARGYVEQLPYQRSGVDEDLISKHFVTSNAFEGITFSKRRQDTAEV